MKIKYKFVTGEVLEVEVEENIGKVIMDLDRVEYNNEKKETRRHCTLSAVKYEGDWFISDIDDPGNDRNLDEMDHGNCPFSDALKKLPRKQQDILLAIYRDGYSLKEYAGQNGISKSAATMLHERAKNNLKKFLENVNF